MIIVNNKLSLSLLEKTLPELLRKAKKDDKSRFSRRTESKKDWSILRIDTDSLRKNNDLIIYFKVHNYQVVLRIVDLKVVLDYVSDSSKYKNDIDKIVKYTLDYCLKHNDIEVTCDCPDFTYRFSYMASQKDYKFGDKESRPSLTRNPKNKVGLCKHIILILNAPSKWTKRVSTVLRNYVKESYK